MNPTAQLVTNTTQGGSILGPIVAICIAAVIIAVLVIWHKRSPTSQATAAADTTALLARAANGIHGLLTDAVASKDAPAYAPPVAIPATPPAQTIPVGWLPTATPPAPQFTISAQPPAAVVPQPAPAPLPYFAPIPKEPTAMQAPASRNPLDLGPQILAALIQHTDDSTGVTTYGPYRAMGINGAAKVTEYFCSHPELPDGLAGWVAAYNAIKDVPVFSVQGFQMGTIGAPSTGQAPPPVSQPLPTTGPDASIVARYLSFGTMQEHMRCLSDNYPVLMKYLTNLPDGPLAIQKLAGDTGSILAATYEPQTNQYVLNGRSLASYSAAELGI